MTSKLFKTSVLLVASAALSAQAGTPTSGKTVVPVSVTEEAADYLVDEVGFSFDAGYESAYYFRGLWFSNNNVFTGLSLSVPLTEKLSLGLGALYTVAVDTQIAGAGNLKYSELDLFGSLTYDAGFASFGLAYTNYTFFDTFSGSINGQTFGSDLAPDSTITGASDIGFTLSVPIADGNVYGAYFYDLKIDAHYFEVGADYTIPVTSWLSLVPSAQIGYGVDYYSYAEITGRSTGWNHVRLKVAAPIQITKSATLIPYIAANFSLSNRELINTVEGKNDLYGGVTLSVAF
ncbi:MAG: hypothetical protein KDK99_03410 [Verrucomicrobiales bacterium]|nr:hypothetical protein [Verrucomicrobiales bacterium]